MFDPRLIEMSRRLAGLVQTKFEEVEKSVREYSNVHYSANDTTYGATNRDSKKGHSINESYKSYSRR